MTAAPDDPRPPRSIEVDLEVPGTPEQVARRWSASSRRARASSS
jgi:hypothetical protein